MTQLALDPAYRRMTVEEFLAVQVDGRAELEDGLFYMMAGGSARHAAVSMNVLLALGTRLRGSGCRAMTSDFAVRTGLNTVRMPDASVYCGFPMSPVHDRDQLLGDPMVVFEVLSPSTRSHDLKVKLPEYKSLEGVQAIVYVDPDKEIMRLVARPVGGDWTDDWLPEGADVTLSCLGITLPHSEIFGRT
jgi:Uma2 family endonuclease